MLGLGVCRRRASQVGQAVRARVTHLHFRQSRIDSGYRRDLLGRLVRQRVHFPLHVVRRPSKLAELGGGSRVAVAEIVGSRAGGLRQNGGELRRQAGIFLHLREGRANDTRRLEHGHSAEHAGHCQEQDDDTEAYRQARSNADRARAAGHCVSPCTTSTPRCNCVITNPFPTGSPPTPKRIGPVTPRCAL